MQDEFSRGRVRLNGGLRYDWQHSKYLGGCVPENLIRPDAAAVAVRRRHPVRNQPEHRSGEEIQPFENCHRVSALTYDLFGNGKTALNASGSYYYKTREITLADNLTGLFQVTRLTLGPTTQRHAAPAPSCWTDANRDGLVQANELIGSADGASAPASTDYGHLRSRRQHRRSDRQDRAHA